MGRVLGIELLQETVDRWMSFAADLDGGAYSSLHFDMTNGKRTELEALHGAVVRHGQRNNVDTSMTEAVYSILKPWARRNESLGNGDDNIQVPSTSS